MLRLSQERTSTPEMTDNAEGKMEVCSGKLLLELALKEYEFEDQRRESIDSKCGTILALLSIVIPAVDGYMISVDTANTICKKILFTVIVIIQVVLFYFLCRTLMARSYKRIHYGTFTNAEMLFQPENITATGFAREISDYIKHNRDQNDIKAWYFDKALISIIMYLAAFGVLMIISILT